MSELSWPEPPLSDGIVRLRPWSVEDSPQLAEASADPELVRWGMYQPPLDLDAAREHIASFERWRGEGTRLCFAITEAGADEALGNVGLGDLTEASAEVFYFLRACARGRGYATRAVRLLCDWAFETHGFHRIHLDVPVGNHPSERVAERAGFLREEVKPGLIRIGKVGVDAIVFGREAP